MFSPVSVMLVSMLQSLLFKLVKYAVLLELGVLASPGPPAYSAQTPSLLQLSPSSPTQCLIPAIGVTVVEVDGEEFPTAFVAVTVIVYSVELDNPVMVCVVASVPAFRSVPSDGEMLMVYPVVGAAVMFSGGVNVIVVAVSPGIAVILVGAFGVGTGVDRLVSVMVYGVHSNVIFLE